VAQERRVKSPRRRTRVRQDSGPSDVTLRQAAVLLERFGLDGKPPRSLEDVSRRYELSRLSVRMLEARMLRALNRIDQERRPGHRAVAEACP
jgi:DNA-directed RNA polymerase sigma subunit (sigma70/sigma32)